MAGAYHHMHGEQGWFDVDDEVPIITNAVELIEEVRNTDDRKLRDGFLCDAASALRGVAFVQLEIDARDGDCECRSCQEDEEDEED